jgi:KDO2-lipid IV(A) lauroyltransferase
MTDPALSDRDGAHQGPVSLAMRLEAIGFRAVAGFARLLPLDVASAFSGWVWRIIAPWLRRDRRAMKQIALALPDLSPAERRAIINRMWRNLGRNFGEAFHLDEIADSPARITLRASDETLARLKEMTKLVVVSMHTGNWEVASLSFAQTTNIPVTGIYQRLKNPLVDRDVVAMRRRFYPLGLLPKGKDALVKMIRTVKNGGAVALLADLRDFRGVMIPFFGRPAPTSTIPAMISLTQDAPVLIGRVLRTKGAHFICEFELMDFVPSGDREADIVALTAQIHARFETWIREYPDQWMWAHRRWG